MQYKLEYRKPSKDSPLGTFPSFVNPDFGKDRVLPADPLVTACTHYRLAHAQNSKYWTNNSDVMNHPIESEAIVKLITKQDIQLANDIAKYYRAKFTQMNLSEVPLSKFRKDCLRVVNDRSVIYYGGDGDGDDRNLLYKLPWFYHYDQGFESIREVAAIDCENKTAFSATVSPLKVLHRSCKNNEIKQYYFIEPNTKEIYRIEVKADNVLLKVWDAMFSRMGNLIITGKCNTRFIDGLKLYDVRSFEIV